MARDAKRDQEDKYNQKRVEEEYRSKERIMGWLEPRSLLDMNGQISSLFSSEASGIVSDIKEVKCMHQFQVNSELEGGVTNDVRGVSIRDRRVGNVLSTNEEMIHEHSQAKQLISTQVLDNTIGDWRQVDIVEGLGSDNVKNKSDSISS